MKRGKKAKLGAQNRTLTQNLPRTQGEKRAFTGGSREKREKKGGGPSAPTNGSKSKKVSKV